MWCSNSLQRLPKKEQNRESGLGYDGRACSCVSFTCDKSLLERNVVVQKQLHHNEMFSIVVCKGCLDNC